MTEVVKKGTKLFVGHNSDNSTDNRKSVGEVVGSFSRTINGKLQALVVTVLSGGTKDLDICSIEADAEYNQNGFVSDIGEITGVALGSSSSQSPAFPGAQRVASLQCFAENTEPDKNKSLGDKQNMAKLTFAEVQQGIKDLNIFPHQVFSMAEFKADNAFGEVFKENERLTNSEKDLTTKLEASEKSGKDAVRANEMSTAKARFEKLIPEGTTEKSRQFMLKRFDPEKSEDLSEESLKKAVTSLQTDYSELAKDFGVSETTEKKPDPSGGSNDDGESKETEDPIESAMNEVMGE